MDTGDVLGIRSWVYITGEVLVDDMPYDVARGGSSSEWSTICAGMELRRGSFGRMSMCSRGRFRFFQRQRKASTVTAMSASPPSAPPIAAAKSLLYAVSRIHSK